MLAQYYLNFDVTNPLLYVLGALGLVFIIQLYYWLVIVGKVAFYKRKDDGNTSTQEPVSVIICARNEEENLVNNLPFILEQDYPQFEVVVVIDCSWDDSWEQLLRMQPNYTNLEIRNIVENENYEHGKKFALTIGIKAAKYNRLVFTDADCIPSGPKWLSIMARNFSSTKQIVLGYGAYKPTAGFLNKVIRFDTLIIAAQYFSAALRGKTYMGVGRNLAYEKELFFNNKGFASHMHIASGDDDLFIQQVATPQNVAIEIDKGGHTLSTPKKTWGEWFIQKRRHLTTAPEYKPQIRTLLSTFWVTNILFYLLLIVLAAFLYNWPILVATFVLRHIAAMVVLAKVANKLGEKGIIAMLPFLEVTMIVLYPTVWVTKLVIRKQKWS